MKLVLQRVESASVEVDKKIIGKINKGILILIGVSSTDDRLLVDKFVDKVSKLRIFEDNNNKTNLSIKDVEGEVLLVSQFTLYADCKKGNRPSFTESAPYHVAEDIYNYFIKVSKTKFKKVECGEFGASMKISLVNDGPFTLILE